MASSGHCQIDSALDERPVGRMYKEFLERILGLIEGQKHTPTSQEYEAIAALIHAKRKQTEFD